MKSGPTNIAASIQARLLEHSRRLGVEHQLTLTRFAGERLLYRLSASKYADRFLLKGAALMLAWLGENIRPTKDIDLLGPAELTGGRLATVFTEIVSVPCKADGLHFDSSKISIHPIREERVYGGMRVMLAAHLGAVRIPLQVDIGQGDSVVPAPCTLEYPSMLSLPRPRLKAYCRETVIAEKCHAMVELASANSRMKDFFDVYCLAMAQEFDGESLRKACAATFQRRRTAPPAQPPVALTSAFSEDTDKRRQWSAFLGRNRLSSAPTELPAVVEKLAEFLWPVLEAMDDRLPAIWKRGGPWRTAARRSPTK